MKGYYVTCNSCLVTAHKIGFLSTGFVFGIKMHHARTHTHTHIHTHKHTQIVAQIKHMYLIVID